MFAHIYLAAFVLGNQMFTIIMNTDICLASNTVIVHDVTTYEEHVFCNIPIWSIWSHFCLNFNQVIILKQNLL